MLLEKANDTHSIEQAIVQDYLDGVGVAIIHYKYRVSYSVIYGVLAREQVPFRVNARKLVSKMKGVNDRMARSIIYDYVSGVTTLEIYKRYNIHKNMLYTILDMHDIPRREHRKMKRNSPTEWLV